MDDKPIERLLTAGLVVFAERGFREATVRDICARAGTNISAIRYYFTSKEMLYREVLAYSFREADRKYPQAAFSDESLPASDRLKIFIRNLLMRLLDESDLGFHARLMAREIAEPTEALHFIIDTVMKMKRGSHVFYISFHTKTHLMLHTNRVIKNHPVIARLENNKSHTHEILSDTLHRNILVL